MVAYRPILLGGGLGLAACFAGFTLGQTPIDDWQLAARYTARISFFLFLIVYCTGPAFRVTRAEFLSPLLRERRYWGLGFALAHGIQLVALVTYFWLSNRPPSMLSLLFGGFGYVLMLGLVVTSNDAAVKRLGRRWKTLHRVGVHYLWLIFALTYLRRTPSPDLSVQGYAFFSIAMAALALRVFAHVTAKRQRAVR